MLTKQPAPGRVKTRLGRSIGENAAAALAWAMLEDVLTRAAASADRAGAALEVLHAPAVPTERFATAVAAAAPSALLRPQGDGALGRRLSAALGDRGAGRLVLGSDAPDLPAAHLTTALRAVAGGEAAIGPAPDGGYTLLGLPVGAPADWLGRAPIRWSTCWARADTLLALRAAGLERVVELPEHPDIDDLSDLRSLAARLAAAPQGAPATWRWLEEQAERWGDAAPHRDVPSAGG